MMPCWYYEKKELRHTPSMSQGMPMDQEISYRREGARFILQVGNKMGLRYETMATGVVYFHRFYMVHTFQEFPRHVTACCCLFLAGKVEETPKKCKDIMSTARGCLTDDSIWSEFGKDPREEVMTLERILLQTIKFDFIVEHPYSYLLKYAKCLKGDKKKLHQIVQMAWTFVNDSLCTTLCLQWEPEIIAIALMYLAGKLNKFEVNDWQGRNAKYDKWWDMFVQGINLDLLEDICHQVLDLYSPNKMDSGGSSLNNPADVAPAAQPATVPVKSSDTPKKAAGASSATVHPIQTVQTVVDVGPPPSKKAKKEEPKIYQAPSPIKPETTTHTPTQSYSYPSHYTANFPPAYPPPPTAPAVTAPPRYSYSYQPPPVPTSRYPQSGTSHQVPPPTTTVTTSTNAAPPMYHPPSHYSPIVYQPTTPTSHYPPQTSTVHPPQQPATTPRHQQPSTHYPPPPHVTAPPYYPPTGTPASRQQTYQPPPSGPYSSSPYMHTGSRNYYPPSS